MCSHPDLSIVRAMLDVQGELLVPVSGRSMYPVLRGGDVVRIVPASRLRPGDIVAIVGPGLVAEDGLSKSCAGITIRKNAQTVSIPTIVHRLVRLPDSNKPMVTWGDNNRCPDLEIADWEVLGRAVAVIRGDTERPLGRSGFRACRGRFLLWLIEISQPVRGVLEKAGIAEGCKRLVALIWATQRQHPQ